MWKIKGCSIIDELELPDQVEAYERALEELVIVRSEPNPDDRIGMMMITAPGGLERIFTTDEVDTLDSIIKGLVKVATLPEKDWRHPAAA